MVSWEGQVLNTIQHDLKCDFLDHLSNGLKHTADTKTSFFVPIALYAIGDEKEGQTAKLAMTGVLLTMTTVFSLKSIVGRERPADHYEKWDSSFPSGHTAFAFSTSIIYGDSYPRLMIPLLIYSSMVGFSRIYLNDHYPTDVLAGMAVGTGIGYAVIKLKKKIISLL